MYKVYINDQPYEIELDGGQPKVNGTACSWDTHSNDRDSFHIIANDTSYRVQIIEQDAKSKNLVLRINGFEVKALVQDRHDLLLEKLGMDQVSDAATNEVRAPMPGLIVELKISEGDQVQSGDPLLVLEAMKMENVLKAPGPGLVKSVLVKQGDSVEKNQILVDFE